MDSSENVSTHPSISKAIYLLTFVLVGTLIWSAMSSPIWGFYGHRKINYMAVFTLPTDMIPFFKHHIGYVSAHAVDPDIRRYATEYEAVRHYIDIDHWGDNPFEEVPRDFTAALAKYSVIEVIHSSGDTSLYDFGYTRDIDSLNDVTIIHVDSKAGQKAFDEYLRFISSDAEFNYYEEQWPLPYREISGFSEIKWSEGDQATLIDRFSGYGILPFYLNQHYHKLVKAFTNQEESRILSLAADMGHYIGDAHVPLHTTENYNGQMTNQLGIHAFWESRIPELQAEDHYDFFVGKAKYIRDKPTFFWKIVEDSHALVADVLRIEKELSETFPSDEQYCYDDRLNRNIRIQCPEYALAYEAALAGTIEARMLESIHAVGSVWYSAWVDAGKPELRFGTETIQDTIIQISESATKVRSY